jgi:hypothetical protein
LILRRAPCRLASIASISELRLPPWPTWRLRMRDYARRMRDVALRHSRPRTSCKRDVCSIWLATYFSPSSAEVESPYGSLDEGDNDPS